ncbi:CAP domain-containing protein [Mechercharimyces sp. CAU 1602]|uniref:CAP domain-containing protein n=1 Tax=Mechercharimyces sp. CAU 1602 TaxID=2973933 RepID=UPI002162D257|nr:CAP domain-containing protein [Mechercharimyces sp. CAU 1602]MCS1351517.1 CAP domain-containing protein [Mechercharimyces sp. CAU 1602]
MKLIRIGVVITLFASLFFPLSDSLASEEIQPMTLDEHASSYLFGVQLAFVQDEHERLVKAKKEKESAQAETTTPPANENNDDSSKKKQEGILPIEQEVIQLVNKERTQRGLQPLQGDSKLSKVARTKSADMRDKEYFSHDSPTYGSPFDMMTQFGVSYSKAAENIAAGQQSAQSVMKSWMNSDGHRKNILDPNLTTIGVGYVEGGSWGTMWTQMFITR